jgi:hypothetical protein
MDPYVRFYAKQDQIPCPRVEEVARSRHHF